MSKRLHIGHLIALGVNSIVGSGIFIVPGLAAAYLGAWSVAGFLICGALLHIVALCYARLARLTSRNGGPYAYAAFALGGHAAFVVGWVTWISSVVSATAVGVALGAYLSPLLGEPSSPTFDRLLAIAVLAVLGIINHVGVSYGGAVMVGLTLLKTLPLIGIAAGGLAQLHLSSLAAHAVSYPAGSQISRGLILILFTCQGFEVVPYIAGETQQPTSQVPKAIVLSLWISILLFATIQLGILGGPAVGSSHPLVDQARFLWGQQGERWVALAGVFSIFGFLAGISLAAPRLLAPLCEDNHLPRGLSKLNPRFETPTRAIWLTTIASMAFVSLGGIDQLVELSSFAVILEYLAASLSLFFVTRRDPVGRWLACASLLVVLAFLTQISRVAWYVMIPTVLVGLVLKALHRHFSPR